MIVPDDNLLTLPQGSVSPAVAGLAISNVYMSASYTTVVMVFKAQFKAFISSLERNFEYLNLPQEAPAEVPDNRPGADWPSRGEIHMSRVSLRYRAELPLVLRDISLTIAGGEKVGVVGRTGAGKSSLISALLRLVELDSGRLVIDGVDIRLVISAVAVGIIVNYHLTGPYIV